MMKIGFFVCAVFAWLIGITGLYAGFEPFDFLVIVLLGGLFLGVASIFRKLEEIEAHQSGDSGQN